MEPRSYDYGGGSGAGGKIRRRPTSRAAASPYARPTPAPAPTTATAASHGGRWLSRIVAAGASRLLPSLFRKSPPQLTAPAPTPPEPLEEPPSSGLLSEPRLEPLNALPSLLPPPLEDDLPEDEENGAIANNNNPPCSVKEDMLSNSDDHYGIDLENLLKRRTFTRSEFDYLAELLWSRTIGSSSLKSDGETRKMPVSEQENGSRRSNLPTDFSITTHSVDDQVASPAEIAKAYMGSKSSKGPPLRLRLHDPSPMRIKSMEASMTQKDKPPTIPLLQSSRLHTTKTSDRLESNYTTPNRSAMYKMSSSPYFKSGVSSKDLFSTISSPYETPSSVHTFGRQVLKRKSSAVNNEIVSVGPIRKSHQRYNRISPLLETRPGYRGFGGHRCKLDEGSEQMAQTQKRRCLDRVSDITLGSSDDTAHASSYGNAPVQSAEMAAKILKELDTLVPAQKEKNHGNALDAGRLVSRLKEVSAQSNRLGPSPSEVKECSLPNGSNGTAKSTSGAVNEKIVAATSIKSNSQKTPSLRSHAPSNLVLSSEIDRNKMSISSNGFTFPVTAVVGAHSQAPPTPTMTFPPILTVEKQQAVFNTSNASTESHPRLSESIPEEGSIAHKFDNNLNAVDKSMPSKNSGQGASFTSNPVFKIVNSKRASLTNGRGDMLNSTVSDTQPSNGPIDTASFQCAGSTISTTASKFIQNSPTGGNFTFSNTAMGSLAASNMFAGTASQSVAAPSLASTGTGGPGSTVAQDKSESVSSSATYSFSQQFFTAGSSTAQDISKATSSEPAVILGNQNGQSGNRNSLFTQNSANNLSFNSSEKSNNGSSQSFSDSQVGSTLIGSNPSNQSSVFPWASASGSASLVATAPPSSPATSSAFGSSPASSASPMFGSKLTTPVPPSFGLPNTGPTTTLFSSPPSAVYSFTSSIPSVPNPSPTTPFGGPTIQINGGNMTADRNGSPFPAASVFSLPSISPSTPTFSTPATQFASNTSSSPGIFGFGQQSQASSGGFSMGPSGGNDKSGRRIIRVKKRK